jgi:hypothetical protein
MTSPVTPMTMPQTMVSFPSPTVPLMSRDRLPKLTLTHGVTEPTTISAALASSSQPVSGTDNLAGAGWG